MNNSFGRLIDGMSHDEMYFPSILLRWSQAHPGAN